MIYDIAIIGAGPGGYVAAIRAAQLGSSVLLIEKEFLGGTCLNRGCIPSKSVITSAEKYSSAKKFSKFGVNIENLGFDYKKISERKDFVVEKMRKSLTQLIKSNKIDVIYGEACIENKNRLKIINNSDENNIIEFKNLIIASGSRTVSLPDLEIDHEFILDTDDVIKLDKIPESVLIAGSGASGIEWARIFNTFGSKVIIVEIAQNLAPLHDKSISERVERIFKQKKIEFYTNTKIKQIINKKVVLDNNLEFSPEIVFLAAGRSPNTEIKGIETLNIAKSGKYFAVDNNLKTNINNIYAVGDVTGLMPLAHTASHQGVAAVENILHNKQANINYNAIPHIIYGNPEICAAGLSEQELIKRNISYKSSIFPVSAAGKYFIEDEIEGFVKVLSDGEKILGVHIITDNGADLIAQAAIAISNNLTVEQIVETVFAHPTHSEALHEAFLGINSKSLHI